MGFRTALALLCLPATSATEAQQSSGLWDREGELWTPRSRLPDFSRAGIPPAALYPQNLHAAQRARRDIPGGKR